MEHNADGLSATRWRRYGKDRVYVNDGEARLGFLDLTTGQFTMTAPERAADVHTAVRRFLDENPDVTASVGALDAPDEIPAPPPPTLTQPTPTRMSDPASRGTDRDDRSAPVMPVMAPPLPAGPDEADLAANRAGAAAMARAKALDQEHPVLNLLARVVGVPTASTSWRVGAKGEKLVGRELDRLERNGWRRLDAIPVGDRGSDIDHFLIGPGGVFTINTKHHPDAKIWLAEHAFLVNGVKHPYLRNSRHEAARAAKLLTAAWGFRVPVTPVIVLVGTATITVKAMPPDVIVLRIDELRAWASSLPVCLDARTITAIHDVARRPTTWTTHPTAER